MTQFIGIIVLIALFGFIIGYVYNLSKEEDHFVEILNVMHNEREIFEIELECGKKIRTSADHRFVCGDGKKRTFQEVLDSGLGIISSGS